MNITLPSIFSQLLNPLLKNYSYIKMSPKDSSIKIDYLKIKYYSELKLLVMESEGEYFTLKQFRKYSSDDINMQSVGLVPCQHP